MNYKEFQSVRSWMQKQAAEQIITDRRSQPEMTYFTPEGNPLYFDRKSDTTPKKPGWIPDAAATYRGGAYDDDYTLAFDENGKLARWHHWYDVPLLKGKLKFPKIENARINGMNAPAEGWGRILEYAPKYGYALHQYPYMAPKDLRQGTQYNQSSWSKRDHANYLLTSPDSPLSEETKQNYLNQPKGAWRSSDTILQRAAYLNWLKQTGGKTDPKAK